MSRCQVERLTAEQRDAYWRDGWQAIGGLFSQDEVEAWRKECDRVWRGLDTSGRDPRIQWRDHADGSPVPDRIDPLLDISPLFKRLSEDTRLLEMVAALIGDRTDVLKGKVIMKKPGTMGYAVHQDYPFWRFLGVPADQLVTAALALDVCNDDSGAMEVFDGRYTEVLPAPEDRPYDVDESRVDLGAGRLVELNPGDVVLFHGLLPHRSAPNRSSHARRMLYFTYVRAGHKDIYARYHAGRPDPHSTQQTNMPAPD